jgi:hypothetical protein
VYAAGVTRHELVAHVRARRWQTFARQSVVLHTGPLGEEALSWAAVFEAGPRAFLDGASALKAAGLRKFDVDAIRVSVPRGARIRHAKGVNIRQTRRWEAGDLAPGNGVPRTRNQVAAIRGALWARSDRQAALLLTMSVQQQLVRPDQLGRELLRIRRDRRRTFLHAVVLDLLDGAQSLGELDVAAECRRRHLPAPTRQSIRPGRGGSYFLDLEWEEWGVVVEIDGIHHAWAQNLVSDALRHNEIALQGRVVLHLPLLGYRVAPEEFFEQIGRALRDNGWPGPADVIRRTALERQTV